MKSKTKFLILLSVGLILAAVGVFFRPVHAQTWVEGHITADTTWTLTDSPFVVIDNVIVDANATLTIEPGVEVRFGDGFSIEVNGDLVAIGTQSDPILFTSNRIAPDPPYPGAWNTIRISGEGNKSAIIKNCIIRYATTGITVQSAEATLIEECDISNSSSSGIHVTAESNVTIAKNVLRFAVDGLRVQAPTVSGRTLRLSGNTAHNNTNYGFQIGSGSNIFNLTISENMAYGNRYSGAYMHAHASIFNTTISGNTAYDNDGHGLYIYSESSIFNTTISGNTAYDNDDHGLYVYETNEHVYDVSISENTAYSNRLDGIYLRGGYWANDFFNITISKNECFLNGGHGIEIFNDGYNSYNNSISENKVWANDGCGISLHTHSSRSNDFSYVKENTVSSNQNGIRASRFKTVCFNNYISYNEYGVYYSSTSDNLANYNDIYSNYQYGMYVDGSSVDAEYNFWGHSTGPHHISLNPTAEGNSANGDGINLDFIPFLTSSVGTINQRPIAVLDVDKTNPNINETVTFDSSASSDDGRIDYYFFDFGDGENSGWTPLSVVTHEYASEDTYNATLVVMDDFGVTSLDGDLVYTEIIVVPEFSASMILPLFIIVTLSVASLAKKRSSFNRDS
jgi:parallel beta-helix repeat protein